MEKFKQDKTTRLKFADTIFDSILGPKGYKSTYGAPFLSKGIPWREEDFRKAVATFLPALISSCKFALNDHKQVLLDLCDVLSRLWSRSITIQEIDKLQTRIDNLICRMNRLLPNQCRRLYVHLLTHLPMQIKMYGPLPDLTMYDTDR
jgi:hypothetical protein